MGSAGRWPTELAEGLDDDVHRALVVALAAAADAAPRTGVTPSQALSRAVAALAADLGEAEAEPLVERARRAGHNLHRSRHDPRAPEFCSCGWMEDLRARAAGAVGQGQAHLRRSLEVPGWA